MMNRALFTSLLHSGAKLTTDGPFRGQILAHKVQHVALEPAIRQVFADNAERRKLKAEALTAARAKRPILQPAVLLAEVLEYREKNLDVLAKVGETLGLTRDASTTNAGALTSPTTSG